MRQPIGFLIPRGDVAGSDNEYYSFCEDQGSAAAEADIYDLGYFAVYAEPTETPAIVKALEWDEMKTEMRRYFQANTMVGQYQISYLGEFECWQLYSPQKSKAWKDCFSRHESANSAKDMAAVDYETLVRSALE